MELLWDRRILELRASGSASTRGSRYERAAKFLKNWQREGVLREEAHPAIYVYHQVFEAGGQTFTRRGFMCRVQLEPFGEGKIYPHEETHAAAKADRLKLITACQANLSQIFGLYPDDENLAQERLEQAIVEVAPLEATDHLGVVHRLWPVTDLATITDVVALMGDKPMYVADGHHRYETACNYRAQQSGIDSEHPANFVLTMCVSMNDPGMIVLPTHRLFRGVESMTSEQLMEKIGSCFDVRIAGEGSDLAHSMWETIETDDDQGTLALYTAADQRWVMAKLNETGRQKMNEVAQDHSADWRGLGVSILQRLLMEHLLGATDLPKPKYVHLVEEVVDELDGDTDNEFALCALVMPATLEHIRRISEHGERMPAKSTYFYPKLLSGLVFNPVA